MLALDSAWWSELKTGGGNPALVVRLIRSLAETSRNEDWDEVWEQVSHQWSAYSVAFAAIPHLVDIAIGQGIATRPDFLLGLGRTVDSLASLGPPPADLRADFETALHNISRYVERAARSTGYAR